MAMENCVESGSVLRRSWIGECLMMNVRKGLSGVLARAMGMLAVACALMAAPATARAATTNDIPSDVKIAQTSSSNSSVADTVTLEAGEDYVVGGEIKINHYEVKGGTEDNPTRIYLTDNAKTGRWLGSLKDMRGSGYDELFVLNGGYVEFIGTSGNNRTPVYCNGKSFLTDNAGKKAGYADGADKNKVYSSLNLKVSGIDFMTLDASKVSKRPLALYGTMAYGEKATFDNVKVSGWNCTANGANYGGDCHYSNIKGDYEASPAPVTILSSANGAKSLDVTFNNCEFSNNDDDCAGALSVVGRGCTPKVVLNNCTFKNNHQGSIWCKELGVPDTNEHTHAGNIVVNKADVTLNDCVIESTTEAANYTPKMAMASAIAVAKNSSCTINSTKISDTYASGTYYYPDANTLRNTVYTHGTVTLAGDTSIITKGDEGARALKLDTPGYYCYGKLNIADSFTGNVKLSIKDEELGSYTGTQWKLGTCGIDEDALVKQVTTDNASIGIGKTLDGYVYASRLAHKHVWTATKDSGKDYQLNVTCTGKMRPSDCNYPRGYSVELTLDGGTLDSNKLGVTYGSKAVIPKLEANTGGYGRDDAVSTGAIEIIETRYYKLDKWGGTAGDMLEYVPVDAGIYRMEAKVRVKDQGDLTLTREFQIHPLDLSKVSGLTFSFEDGESVTIDERDMRGYPWTGERITPQFSVMVYDYGAHTWKYFTKGVDYTVDTTSKYSTTSAIDPPDASVYPYTPYYQLYIKGAGNYTGSACALWTITGTQFENVKATGFEGTYDGRDHKASVTVSNAPEDMKVEYSVDDGESWTEEAPSYRDVQRDNGKPSGKPCAVTVKYRITAKDYVTKNGEVTIKIEPAEQPIPQRYTASLGTGIKVKDESAHLLGDGSFSNLDENLEYKGYYDYEYKSLSAGQTSIENLEPGNYTFRYKADNNHWASQTNTFEIRQGPCAPEDDIWYKTEGENGSHWQKCRCGEKINKGSHGFYWEEVKSPTADKAGLKRYQCAVCGYVLREEEIPPACIGGYVGEYDGEEHQVTTDLKDGESVRFSADGGKTWTNDAPAIKDVGKITVAFELTRADASKLKGSTTLEITPRDVTVAPAPASKTYGDQDPDFTYEVKAGSLVQGEKLAGITYTREAGENVLTGYKTYKVTASQAKDANLNYNVEFEPGEFTIRRRTVEVEWAVAHYVYNGKEQGPTAKITNLVNGDDVSLKLKDNAKTNAGSYTATVNGITGDSKVLANYCEPNANKQCRYSIAKADWESAPNVKAVAETVSGKRDGKIKGVDSSMQLSAKGTEMMFIKKDQLVDGDTLENLAPGTYKLRYGSTTNYNASKTVEVTVAAGRKLAVALPAEQVGYSLTADATELDWHQNLTLTFALTDGYYKSDAFSVQVNGEPVALSEDGTATVAGLENDVTVAVEGVRKHEAANDAWHSDESGHWRDCTCGGRIDEAAHAFEWVVDRQPTATEAGAKHERCTVCGYAKDPVEIPAVSVAGYEGEYDGQWHGPDTSKVPEGLMIWYSYDNGASWTTGEPGRKDAGTEKFIYKVTVDGVDIEGEAAITIAPRKITVAASDASKVYGEADPELGYAVTAGSLVEGESLSDVSVAREKGEAARDAGYAINVSQKKDANPNYDVSFAPGSFAITKRPLTVTWGTTAFVYDGKEHAPVVELGNIIVGDDVEAVAEGAQIEANRADEAYVATVTGLTGSDAGNYALPADGLTCDFVIENAPQGAPAIQARAESISGKHDGVISGVDASMEYRAERDDSYTAIEGSKLEKLAPGAYCVRYKAKENHDASPDTTVTIAAGRKLVVALPSQQEGYTLTATASELDWRGSATLKLDIDQAYFSGKGFAVKVNGKRVDFADGAYELKNIESDINVTVEGVFKHEADGTGWKSDDGSHWHICRCGDVIDKAAHDFEWVVDTPATAESKGSRHQECKVCGTKGAAEDIAMLPPSIIEGAGQTLAKPAEVPVNSDLTVRSNAPISLFKQVLVDGVEVADKNYELREGSTIVTLKASYLATLGLGEHKLSVVSETGTAETTFTIVEQQKPADNAGAGAAGGGKTETTTTTTVTTTSSSKGKAGKGAMPSVGDSALVMAASLCAAGAAALVLAVIVKRR